jgi:hypothetical protein
MNSLICIFLQPPVSSSSIGADIHLIFDMFPITFQLYKKLCVPSVQRVGNNFTFIDSNIQVNLKGHGKL